VRLPSKDEDMLVHAFKKGVLPGPFSESLIRNHPSTFAEIRHRVVVHIVAETEVSEKRGSAAPTKSRAGPSRSQQPMRVHEAKEGKKAQGKPRPYEPRKDLGGGRARESNEALNSLKQQRSVCHVTSTPPPGVDERRSEVEMVRGTQRDVEMEEAMSGGSGVSQEEAEKESMIAPRESGIARAVIASERRPHPAEG